MKAVLLRRSPSATGNTAEVSEVPTPVPGPGEITVEMKACGLCGTDVEKIRGEYTAAMPVLGHEAVGVVAAVAEGVDGFRIGDRVFPHHHVPCGECHYCRSGSETMCERYRSSNLEPGGFAEVFRVPRWNVERGGVLRLPKELSFEAASLLEPVACCLRALDRCEVSAGDSALVVGAGPVGLAHAMLLRSMKAKVLVSDVSRWRLEFAERVGVDGTLDATKGRVSEEVRERTSGVGADIAIVAAGNPRAIVQALKSVRKGGKVCLFGIPPKGSSLDYDVSDIYNSEVSLVTSYGATELETKMALDLMTPRRADFARLVTDTFPLERFDEAVRVSTGGEAMKVVLTP